MSHPDPRILAILRIAHDVSSKGAGISLRKALARTQYAEVRRDLGPSDLLPLIQANPELVEEWLAFSEDKRTGGLYLTRQGAIGYISTGRSSENHFARMEEAVAEYVLRELDFWVRVGKSSDDGAAGHDDGRRSARVAGRRTVEARRKRRLAALLVILGSLLSVALLTYSQLAPDRLDRKGQTQEPGPDARAELDAWRAEHATSQPTRAALVSESQSAAPGALRVKVVLHPEEEPCPSVLVSCVPMDGSDETFATRGAATGADGVAAFENLPPGPMKITSDRLVDAKATVESGRTAEVTLRIEHGIDVRGVVLDPTGQPVPGAEIWIYPPSYWRYQEQARAVGHTDGVGRFELRRMGGPIGFWLGARARGLAPSAFANVSVAGTKSPFELVLRFAANGSGLRARVVDEAGQPVARAQVLHIPAWVPPQGVDGVSLSSTVPTEAFTNAEGGAELHDLAAGKCELLVRGCGFAPRSVFAELFADRTVDAEIRLSRGVTLHGFVRDPTGQPVAGAKVQVDRRLRASSGARGDYRLEGVPLGDIGALVEADGYREHRESLRLAKCEDVEWSPTLQAKPEARIRCRLLDAHGAPLVRWAMSARSVAGNAWAGAAESPSDAQGRATILVAPEGRYRLFATEVDQHTSIPCEGVGEVEPGGNEITITVGDHQRATAYLEGVVIDGNDRPVCELTVYLDRNRFTPGCDPKTGRFRVGPLPAGSYRLEFASEKGSIPRFAAGEHRLLPDTVTDAGRLRVPEHGTLRYRLLPRDGHVLRPEHWIWLSFGEGLGSGSPSGPDSIQLDANGNGSVALAPGRHLLVVHGADFVGIQRAVEIRAAQVTELDVPLRQATARFLAIHRPEGETSLRVEIREDGGELVFQKTFEPADVRPWPRKALGYFAAGRHVVTVTGGSGKRYGCTFTVEDLEPSRDVIDLKAL